MRLSSYIHSPVALVLREREREQVPWNLWITPPRFPRFHGTYGSRNTQMNLFRHILFLGTRKYTRLCPILFPGTIHSQVSWNILFSEHTNELFFVIFCSWEQEKKPVCALFYLYVSVTGAAGHRVGSARSRFFSAAFFSSFGNLFIIDVQRPQLSLAPCGPNSLALQIRPDLRPCPIPPRSSEKHPSRGGRTIFPTCQVAPDLARWCHSQVRSLSLVSPELVMGYHQPGQLRPPGKFGCGCSCMGYIM